MPLIQPSKWRVYYGIKKKAIYNLIPQKYYPITELIKEAALEEIKTTIEQAFIQYLL
jgi:TnpA family transposase